MASGLTGDPVPPTALKKDRPLCGDGESASNSEWVEPFSVLRRRHSEARRDKDEWVNASVEVAAPPRPPSCPIDSSGPYEVTKPEQFARLH